MMSGRARRPQRAPESSNGRLRPGPGPDPLSTEADRCAAPLFAYEVTTVRPGAGEAYLDAVRAEREPILRDHGHRLVGAFTTVGESCAVTLWACDVDAHIRLQRAYDAAVGLDDRRVRRRSAAALAAARPAVHRRALARAPDGAVSWFRSGPEVGTMRFVLGLPTDQVDRPAEFLTAEAIAQVAQAAEAAGFDAVGVTDHPFPQDKWLSRGGHQALDPMVALSFAAARTQRIRLLTNIFVLPYHNPFLTARAVASLDVLSAGRVIFGTAVGYLRSEFAALGVEYEDRAARTDEALELMRLAWTGESVSVEVRSVPGGGAHHAPGAGPAAAPADLVRRQQSRGHAPNDPLRAGLDAVPSAGRRLHADPHARVGDDGRSGRADRAAAQGRRPRRGAPIRWMCVSCRSACG